jgi:hypothetical protein
MTVTTASSRVDYLGAASVGPYSVPFRFFAAGDLEVIRTTAGVETVLANVTDYSVTGVGNKLGGTITLVTALAVGSTLTIRRVIDLTQESSLRNQGTFHRETVEDMVDRTVMMVQQIDEVDARRMVLPVGTDPTVVSAVLPVPTANRALFWNASATAIESRVLDDSDNVALPGEGRTVADLTAYLANNAVYNIKDYGAVGDGTTDDTAAIAAAISAAPSGAVLRIPKGTYRVVGSGTYVFRISRPLTILYDGWDALISVDAAVPNTRTIFLVKNLGDLAQLTDIHFLNGSIQPASGNPGKYGIEFDSTLGDVAYCSVVKCSIGALSNYSIATTNPLGVNANGTLYLSEIAACKIAGGMNLDYCGDSIRVLRNVFFTLAGNANQLGIRIKCVYTGTDGAHGIKIEENNITCAGGILYLSGNVGQIVANNIESPHPSTGPNLAMVDLAGESGAPLVGIAVARNFLGAGATTLGVPNTNTTVRIGYAEKTHITENMTGSAGSPAVMYHNTVNALGTTIAGEWNVSATLLDSYLRDEGKGTNVDWIGPGSIYFMMPHYLSHKSARANMTFLEAGHEQYAEQVMFGVLTNDPNAPTVALVSSAGNLSVGGYRYRVAFVTSGVEQQAGTVSALAYVTTPASIGRVALTGIPLGPTGTTARKIYRTLPDGSAFFLLATIADNTTTVYTDNIADGSLGAAYSIVNGSGVIKPTTGTPFGSAVSRGALRVLGDGTVIFGDGANNGVPVQFNDYASFVAGASFVSSIGLLPGAYINMRNVANDETFTGLSSSSADNTITLGSHSVPANGTDQRIILFKYNGVEKARVNSAGLKVVTGFGCNGTNPQTAASVGAALAAYSAGANGLASGAAMAALVAKVSAMEAALKANGILID